MGIGLLWRHGAAREGGHLLAPVATGLNQNNKHPTGPTKTNKEVSMKTLTKLGTAAALTLAAGTAHAADELSLQLKWVTQAQFAGYYVAADKGFYEEEDLDVTIKPGGPDIAPVQVLLGGGADVMVDWLPSALAARENGAPIVNIAQPFKSSGLMLTCLKEHGIESPEDFPGHTLGTWFFGNELPLYSWMSK